MWVYEQNTGILRDDNGQLIARGYSGHGDGLNNPLLQDVAMVGPIPRGIYEIEPAVDNETTGPLTIPLVMLHNIQTSQRYGFLIHGDEINPLMPRNASHGCIILDRDTRETIAHSDDHYLVVIAGQM